MGLGAGSGANVGGGEMIHGMGHGWSGRSDVAGDPACLEAFARAGGREEAN